MNTFLIKLCVKDYQNTDDPAVRERYGKFAGIVGILSNLILCTMKIVIGLISSSIAIVALSLIHISSSGRSVPDP